MVIPTQIFITKTDNKKDQKHINDQNIYEKTLT